MPEPAALRLPAPKFHAGMKDALSSIWDTLYRSFSEVVFLAGGSLRSADKVLSEGRRPLFPGACAAKAAKMLTRAGFAEKEAAWLSVISRSAESSDLSGHAGSQALRSVYSWISWAGVHERRGFIGTIDSDSYLERGWRWKTVLSVVEKLLDSGARPSKGHPRLGTASFILAEMAEAMIFAKTDPELLVRTATNPLRRSESGDKARRLRALCLSVLDDEMNILLNPGAMESDPVRLWTRTMREGAMPPSRLALHLLTEPFDFPDWCLAAFSSMSNNDIWFICESSIGWEGLFADIAAGAGWEAGLSFAKAAREHSLSPNLWLQPSDYWAKQYDATDWISAAESAFLRAGPPPPGADPSGTPPALRAAMERLAIETTPLHPVTSSRDNPRSSRRI